MDERDGVVGLALVAVLAWLLPAAVRVFDARPALQPVITARADPDSSAGFRYHWSSPPRALGPDGWVVAPDGSPLSTAPGWRGLLLGHPLDLNTATAADLEALPGIGPHTAAAALADRDAKGPYAAVEELARVRGIGPNILQRLHPFLRVGRPLPTDGRVPPAGAGPHADRRPQHVQERGGSAR